jgi:hypothetical protein
VRALAGWEEVTMVMMRCPHCGDRWRPATRAGKATRVCPNCRAVPALGALVEVSTSSRPPRADLVWAAVGVLEILVAFVLATGAIGLAASSSTRIAKQHEVAVAPAPDFEAPTAPAVSEPPAAVTPAVAERREGPESQAEMDWAALLGPEVEALTVQQLPAPSPAKEVEKPEPIVAVPAAAKATPTGTCGTALDFVGNLTEATARAKIEHRLLFVLHVSGNFEEPGFT